MVKDISQLKNIGQVSASWLRRAGITTVMQARQAGAVYCFLKVKRQTPQAGLNLLWALAAGLQNRNFRDLTDQEKTDLLAEIENLPE